MYVVAKVLISHCTYCKEKHLWFFNKLLLIYRFESIGPDSSSEEETFLGDKTFQQDRPGDAKPYQQGTRDAKPYHDKSADDRPYQKRPSGCQTIPWEVQGSQIIQVQVCRRSACPPRKPSGQTWCRSPGLSPGGLRRQYLWLLIHYKIKICFFPKGVKNTILSLGFSSMVFSSKTLPGCMIHTQRPFQISLWHFPTVHPRWRTPSLHNSCCLDLSQELSRHTRPYCARHVEHSFYNCLIILLWSPSCCHFAYVNLNIFLGWGIFRHPSEIFGHLLVLKRTVQRLFCIWFFLVMGSSHASYSVSEGFSNLASNSRNCSRILFDSPLSL